MATDPRIDALVHTLSQLAALDFTARASPSGQDDEIDALTEGINMLAEELEASTVSRAELQEREHRLSATFQAVLDSLVVMRADGTIESVNGSAEEMFGYGEGGLVGHNLSALLAEGSRSAVDVASLPVGTTRQVDAIRKDGDVFPAELSLSRLSESEGGLFVALIRDVTQRQKVDRLKDEFVSVVSHELRTPLTSIRGSLGLLVGGATGELPERATQLLDVALRNTERLVRLINDILDIDRIAQGKLILHVAPVSVRGLLTDAIEAHRALSDAKGLEVLAELGPDIEAALGDRDRLLQVLTNLISNAIEFSPPEGQIVLGATAVADEVHFFVRDQGPGIPVEFQTSLFERFTQADSSTQRTAPGSGLGLSIAKAVVEEHGGRMWFETGTNTGTTMFFSVPQPRALAGESLGVDARGPGGGARDP